MSTFRIRYSELNTTNLQDLNSDLQVINSNNVFNKSITIPISSSQINNLSSSPILILPQPGTINFYTINNISLYQDMTGTYNSVSTMEIYYGTGTSFPINSGLTNFVDDILTNGPPGQYGFSTSSPIGSGETVYSNINNALYLNGNYNSGTSNIKLNINYNVLQV